MKKRSKLRIFIHNLKVLYKRKRQNSKSKKKTPIVLLLSLGLVIIIIVSLCMYFNNLKPVKQGADDVLFTIESGDTYGNIGTALKDAGLIKSNLAYKIYVKTHSCHDLHVGMYILNPNMDVATIIDTLKAGSKYGAILTIPEGKNLEQIAGIASQVTNNSKDDLLKAWNDSKFVSDVINKYWFVTNDVKNSEIRYPLEGYLFPDTYYLKDKNVTPEEIAYKMLDQMDNILSEHKDELKANNFTVHNLLTMASVIEQEGVAADDRAKIASVFYNRLNNGMTLGSDVTTYYAVNKNFQDELTQADLATCNGYNTRSDCVKGLPVGPICSPGSSSLIAVIEPAKTEYYYFIADTCSNSGATYFANTYQEHETNVARYLTC